jgi:cytochrome b subunit of formate dehydrogenase
MFLKIKKLYQKYRNYMIVDAIMYLLMILLMLIAIAGVVLWKKYGAV